MSDEDENKITNSGEVNFANILDDIAVSAISHRAINRDENINGILIGSIDSFNQHNQQAQIILPGLIDQAVDARSLSPMNSLAVGDQVAVMFESGNIQEPIIMGALQQPVIAISPSDDIEKSEDADSLHIRSKKELNLQCGEASLRMTADGCIELRGSKVVTHSKGLNRIRGASVKIN